MSAKPMLSVERELLEDMLNPCADFATHERLRALLDKPATQPQGEPVAYQRLWDALGEKPYKEKNKNNRMAWAKKFVFHPITKIRVFEDDIALYAEQPMGIMPERRPFPCSICDVGFNEALDAVARMNGCRS